MMQRKVVMVSSTARDLPKHRHEVRVACERFGFEPREMMEHLTAENRNAVEVSLRMVEQADVFLGILAYRYGTVPTGYDISITEMEFNRALELKKPMLVFFMHEDHPVVKKDVDTGTAAEKLQALKDRIGEARGAAFFKSPDDLRAHAGEALNRLAKEFEAPEAGGAAAIAAVQLHRKTSIPAPPEPYIAHPYTLSAVIGVIAVVASGILYFSAPSILPEETESHGWLLPAQEKVPKNGCTALNAQIPSDAILFIAGTNAAWTTSNGKSRVLNVGNVDFLFMERDGSNLGFDADVYDDKGNLAVRIIKDEFHLIAGQYSYRDRSSDRSKLTVYDKAGNEMLYINRPNPTTVLIRGVFVSTNGFTARLTDDAIIVPGNNKFVQNCKGSFGGDQAGFTLTRESSGF